MTTDFVFAPNGAILWIDTRFGGGKPRAYPGLRGELDKAIDAYERRSGCGPLPACSLLATSPNLRVAQDVIDAAARGRQRVAPAEGASTGEDAGAQPFDAAWGGTSTRSRRLLRRRITSRLRMR